MAQNAFGDSVQQYPLIDPRSVRENRKRFRRDTIVPLEYANSFYCPAGRQPCRGWILLARGDYDKLNQYSTQLQLTIGAPNYPDNVQTLQNLSIVHAQCVTRGLASDPNAIYLVELTDARGVLANKWFQQPTVSMYNVWQPGFQQLFYPQSLNDGAPWDWTGILQDLWNQMPSLGAWPLFNADSPDYLPPPEGIWFQGVSVWHALCDILDHLGLTVTCNLAQNPSGQQAFNIIAQGAPDTAFSAQQQRYTTNIEDDLEWIDIGASRVPAFVVVLFRRRNTIYADGNPVTYLSGKMSATQWGMTTYYSVTTEAPSIGGISTSGIHYIWSDFTVRYDGSNNPLSADASKASALAVVLTDRYFDRIYYRLSGFMSQTYAGALPFITGSQVGGVCYYQDYRHDDRQGWRTQIVRSTPPMWRDIYADDLVKPGDTLANAIVRNQYFPVEDPDAASYLFGVDSGGNWGLFPAGPCTASGSGSGGGGDTTQTSCCTDPIPNNLAISGSDGSSSTLTYTNSPYLWISPAICSDAEGNKFPVYELACYYDNDTSAYAWYMQISGSYSGTTFIPCTGGAKVMQFVSATCPESGAFTLVFSDPTSGTVYTIIP